MDQKIDELNKISDKIMVLLHELKKNPSKESVSAIRALCKAYENIIKVQIRIATEGLNIYPNGEE